MVKLLPLKLAQAAVMLDGEVAWTREASFEVIDWLTQSGYAVVGIEVWRNAGGHPLWVASSQYECAEGDDWSHYSYQCGQEARAFLDSFSGSAGTLFNLAWVSWPHTNAV